LYHQKGSEVSDKLLKLNNYIFTDDILYDLNYLPISNSLMPGSNHFPLLKFFTDNPQFDFYWYIESDVVFNGDWEYLIYILKIKLVSNLIHLKHNNFILLCPYLIFYSNFG